MESNEFLNKDIYNNMIIESVRYYSIYHFEIREFLQVYGKRRMMEDIRNAVRYNDEENEIMELLQYTVRKPGKEIIEEIQGMVREYYKYLEMRVITFKMRILSKIMIFNRMIKEGYV